MRNLEKPKIEKETEDRPEPTSKEKHLKEIEERVERIADALGKPIDSEIKKTIISLQAWEFPTYQSCEGHSGEFPEEEGESRSPWVWIEAPEPENLEKDESAQKEWKKENLKHQSRMIELLDEFYQDRNTPFDVRLYIESKGIYGSFAIANQGANVIETLSPQKQKKKRLAYQKEMQEFGKFLKEKYLQNE